jgi:UDP-N-acetyl-D-glucosamine dehydrogenase
MAKDWKQLIKTKKVVVGILGLGYVGLPLAREFATSSIRVLGFDTDANKVDVLNKGRSIIKNVPHEQVGTLVNSGLLSATCDMSRIKEVDAVLICVPTPLNEYREPDMQYINNSCEIISQYLQPGQFICLESTTYPGTTRELMLPILENSGLRAGKDFYLGYSPEREDPGNKTFTTRTIPKVISGLTPQCRDIAERLYAQAVDTLVPVSSLEVAEATKIMENIYRCINIAMVNELKIVFDRMGIDIWDVIRAASTKPFGFNPFFPGPGLGGHCIPIDPFYLTWKARQYGIPTRFIELAGEINTDMPRFVITKTMDALNEHKKSLKGSKILILGLAYKPDIDDVRESPALKLIELLKQKGAHVDYNDPFIAQTHKQRDYDFKMKSKKLTASMLQSYDAVIIATNHSHYNYEWIVNNAHLVIDTRNATAGMRSHRAKIVKA